MALGDVLPFRVLSLMETINKEHCPCTVCRGRVQRGSSTIRRHLREFGMQMTEQDEDEGRTESSCDFDDTTSSHSDFELVTASSVERTPENPPVSEISDPSKRFEFTIKV